MSGLIHHPDYAELLVGTLLIVTAPEYEPPFRVDALVSEEDTFLIMAPDNEIRDSSIGIHELKNHVTEMEPVTPGTVIVKEGSPMRFLAVVYDFDREPHWNEEWVRDALNAIFQETEKHKLSSIALPLIGTLHSSLKRKRFAALLSSSLDTLRPNYLKNIWIIVDEGTGKHFFTVLKSAFQK